MCRWYQECFASIIPEQLAQNLGEIQLRAEEELVLADGSTFFELIFTGIFSW